MGYVDQRMPPSGNFDFAILTLQRIVIWLVVMPKPKCTGTVLVNLDRFGNHGQHFRHLLGVAGVELKPLPCRHIWAPVPQSFAFEAGFNGQQTQTCTNTRFISNFGWAHGRTACARRHDPTTVVREEHCVNQLGLASGIFRHKGHHQFVVAHSTFELYQPLFDSDA